MNQAPSDMRKTVFGRSPKRQVEMLTADQLKNNITIITAFRRKGASYRSAKECFGFEHSSLEKLSTIIRFPVSGAGY